MSSVTLYTHGLTGPAFPCSSASISPHPWRAALPCGGAVPCGGRWGRQHGHLRNPHPRHILDPEGPQGVSIMSPTRAVRPRCFMI